jgi:hypothetical protein
MMSKTMDWQPIANAPRNGRAVLTCHHRGNVPTPLRACFYDGQWLAEFDAHWCRFDPQPAFWRPIISYEKSPPE